ncbi:AAA family ATPase [Psychromonas sp. Urea-02u-13]|uniref:AAA family ATPase n=1 Tax=Psychromonas sp. Urea-02u-13 TaxID=2058326 RepID=UPI000C331B8E|nr:AAA family ATPase [Psychromonas sp. Urea-02u-13]PKG40365.1 AAA family ATPase [Psychromonas sp. Urea-02u-13]
MKITNISIKNFKRFEDELFLFNPKVTVLIGDNGTGKSTVLDALSFILGTFFLGVDGVKSRPLSNSEKRRVIASPESVEVQLPFCIGVEHSLDNINYQWKRSTNKVRSGVTSQKEARDLINKAKDLTERVRNGEEVNLPLIAYYGTERLSEQFQKSAYAKKSSRLDGYYSALDPRSFEQKFLSWFKTFEDSALKFNKDKTLYNAFISAIKNMIPEWKNVVFSWEADDMLCQVESGDWVAYKTLSSGYKNVVRLTADIAYRAIKLNPHLADMAVLSTSGVVLIDELDMHLHPKWQKTIIEDLKRTFPKIQFIVTTHSPFIIQSLKTDEVLNLDGGEVIDPFMKSIDDIAEEVQQIEIPQMSNKKKAMLTCANEYFDKLDELEKSNVTEDQILEIKNRLDEISALYEDNMAYVAFLERKRLITESKL